MEGLNRMLKQPVNGTGKSPDHMYRHIISRNVSQLGVCSK